MGESRAIPSQPQKSSGSEKTARKIAWNIQKPLETQYCWSIPDEDPPSLLSQHTVDPPNQHQPRTWNPIPVTQLAPIPKEPAKKQAKPQSKGKQQSKVSLFHCLKQI